MFKTKLNLRIVVTIVICLAVTTVFWSCDQENDNHTKVEENGLTKDINDLISPEVLAEIESLGMPIFRGGNPPENIIGAYIASPDICVATNRPNDEFGPGHRFADFYFNLTEQDNTNLTIKVATAQVYHSGEGTGAYIVGNGSQFSIFCPLNSTQGSGHKYKNVVVFSGSYTADGIKDFYHSTFMLEGGGFEWGLIENGQGRVVYDSDGMSDRTTWTYSIPANTKAATIESISNQVVFER